MSLGIHISKNSHVLPKNQFGKHKTVISAVKTEVALLNMSAFSMFILGPLNKAKIAMDLQNIKKYCEENNIAIWPHGSYISVGIWGVNIKNRHENKSLMWIRHIRDHLVIGKQLGAKGVVIHVPRHPIEVITETMEILSDCKVINSIRRNKGTIPNITLEMPASKPHEELTYETPEKLNTLVKALHDDKKITILWDICIDTCHLHSGGISFLKPNSWHEYETALSPLVKEKLKLIHLNSSKLENFGTGKDGHVCPLSKDDYIWSNLISEEFRDFIERSSEEDIVKINLYEKLSASELAIIKNSSLYDIIKFAKKNDVSMILELNRENLKDAKVAMDIINGLLKSARGGSVEDSMAALTI